MDPALLAALPVDASAFLLLFGRVGAVLMLLPVFSEDAVPSRVRLMLAFGMTLAMWGLLSPQVLPHARDMDALPGVLIVEVLIGLGLGMLVRLMFLAVAAAGSIISLQVGLTSAIMPDSMQGGAATVLTKFLSVSASVMCMAMLVHHQWILAIVKSYQTFPVGGLPPAGDFAQLAIATATRSLALAVGLAAPMIVYGLVFNVGLGLAARVAPAIQVFFIAQPLNLVAGIALFAVLGGAMLNAFAASFGAWMQTGLGG